MKQFISEIICIVENELTKEEIKRIGIDTLKAFLIVMGLLVLFERNLSLGIAVFIFNFVMYRRKVRRMLKKIFNNV